MESEEFSKVKIFLLVDGSPTFRVLIVEVQAKEGTILNFPTLCSSTLIMKVFLSSRIDASNLVFMNYIIIILTSNPRLDLLLLGYHIFYGGLFLVI